MFLCIILLMEQTTIFTLTSLSPVGFIIPKYEFDICVLCRHPLSTPCETCHAKHISQCQIIEVDHMHKHCYDTVYGTGK